MCFLIYSFFSMWPYDREFHYREIIMTKKRAKQFTQHQKFHTLEAMAKNKNSPWNSGWVKSVTPLNKSASIPHHFSPFPESTESTSSPFTSRSHRCIASYRIHLSAEQLAWLALAESTRPRHERVGRLFSFRPIRGCEDGHDEMGSNHVPDVSESGYHFTSDDYMSSRCKLQR